MSTNAIPAQARADAPARKTTVARVIDLNSVLSVPSALVDEHVAAAVTGRPVRSLRGDRLLRRGIPYRKLNGSTVRYRVADITKWIEEQPLFCGFATTEVKRGPGRPRKA